MTKNQCSARRKTRQSGHTMLESAFILIPFLALLFGIVDFGMSLFVKSTIQNAVAAGVRYAVTSQTKPGLCMDDSIRVVTQSNAMGFLGDPATPNAAISVNYYATTDLSTPLAGGSIPPNSPGNVIEVTASYQWNWLTNLSGMMGAPKSSSPLNVTAYSSDRVGNLAPGQAPPCR
jgi:TadE-like protein